MSPKTKDVFDAMRERTKHKIDITALSLFARKGLSVKISEIANSAGISQGLIYSHYPSKDALIGGLISQATAISGHSIKEIANTKDSAAEKIKSITTLMCKMFATAIAIDYFMFMVQVGMSDFQIPKGASYSLSAPNPADTLAKLLSKGQQEGSVVPGDPYQLAIIYWAAIQGLCGYALSGMTVSPSPKTLNRIVLKEEFL